MANLDNVLVCCGVPALDLSQELGEDSEMVDLR